MYFSGIVRGVEMEKKLYHVLTPVPPENLRQVNCLLLGNIAIPNCVLVSQVGVAWEEGGKKGTGLLANSPFSYSEAYVCPEMSGH